MADQEELTPPANTMRERRGESRVQLWFLVTGHRLLVSGVLLSITFAVVAVLVGIGPTRTGPATPSIVGSMFGSMIIVVVTGVTFVLAVAQLVISEELGPIGEKREEMAADLAFREEFESILGAATSPTEPTEFLRRMIRTCAHRADRMLEFIDQTDEENVYTDAVRTYAEGVSEHSREVHENLEGGEFGTFDLLRAVLDYNYSWKLAAGQAIYETYGDELPDALAEQIDELNQLLELFGPAREYIKTLYFRWEIINLARLTIYTGLFALGIAGYMVVLFDPSAVTGAMFGIDRSTAFAMITYVATLSPFAVLLAYIMRIITIEKRTLATGTFILRMTKHTPATEQGAGD